MRKLTNNDGFTLAEIVIATMILVVLFSGIMITYLKCLDLNEISSNASLAVMEAKNKLMEIENVAFATIEAAYDNVPFAVASLNGMGVTYVDDSVPNILTITVVVCWQQRNGRVFGEDDNLNGVLNGGEDDNGNGRLDSTVQFVTQKYNI